MGDQFALRIKKGHLKNEKTIKRKPVFWLFFLRKRLRALNSLVNVLFRYFFQHLAADPRNVDKFFKRLLAWPFLSVSVSEERNF